MRKGKKEPDDRAAAPAEAAAQAICYLDPQTLHFQEHGASLRLTVKDDRSYLKVTLARAFPLSDPTRYLSVRFGENKEAGVIRDPAELDGDNRRLVEREIGQRYLVAIIERILKIKERFGTLDWEVQTDRGVCRFTTRNLRENVSKPAPGRYLVGDVDGNRYDLADLNALDPASQALLMRYL